MKKEGQKHRVDDFEIERRHQKVALLILSGYTKRSFLLQKIAEDYPDWNVEVRQLDNYIRAAKELIKNQYTEEDFKFERDVALSRFDGLYTMNLKIQDYRECRNLIMDRMKVLGLLTDKVETTDKSDRNLQIEIVTPDKSNLDVVLPDD